MVIVCDKCRNELRVKGDSTIKIKGKTYELCSNCLEEILYWINKGAEKQNPLKRLLG